MRIGTRPFTVGTCAAGLALFLMAYASQAKPISTGNNNDPCTELDARNDPPGSDAAERVAAARLACRLPANVSAVEAKRLLGSNSLAINVDGDNVTFLARADARAVSAAGTITAPMDRVGPSLWALRLRIAHADRALLQFFATDDARDNEHTKLRELTAQLTTVQAEVRDAQSRQRAGAVDADTLPEVVQNAAVQSIRTTINQLEVMGWISHYRHDFDRLFLADSLDTLRETFEPCLIEILAGLVSETTNTRH